MDCAVHNDDVQQIIIDNLQFMMPVMSSTSSSGLKQGFEKFDYQDYVIYQLRKFATERNVRFLPYILAGINNVQYYLCNTLSNM